MNLEMPSSTNIRVFQTHLFPDNHTLLIRDDIQGEMPIYDSVLVKLLQSPEVQRLPGIY
jgi:hypothetical protein